MSRKLQYLVLMLIIAAAGCGLRPLPTATPEFFSQQVLPTSTPFFIATATPFVVPPVTVIIENPTPVVIVPDDPSQDGGLVRDIIEGFILPIWNFLVTLTVGTIQTLWITTGQTGGVGAQAACCGLPAILSLLWVTRWYRRYRYRK